MHGSISVYNATKTKANPNNCKVSINSEISTVHALQIETPGRSSRASKLANIETAH